MSNVEQFRAQLGAVPARLAFLSGRVRLDAYMIVYERIAQRTKVDTGFLRASLSATRADDTGEVLTGHGQKGQSYSADDAMATAAIAAAAKDGSVLHIGYGAEYAPYVEDRYHMVSSVLMEWPAIVNEAVHNAGATP